MPVTSDASGMDGGHAPFDPAASSGPIRVVPDHDGMKTPDTYYLRKRSAAQPCWRWLDAVRDSMIVPLPLLELVERERTFVGAETAQRALDWLRSMSFEDDAGDNYVMPVETVDYDGNLVALTSS